MSTMIALLLVLSTLAGCSGGSAASVQSAAFQSAPPPALSVETRRISDTLPDGDGAPLVDYSYEIPVLQPGGDGPDHQRAQELADIFNAEFAPWTDEPVEMAAAARENRAFQVGSGLDFFPYTDQLTCAVYQTGQLISVSGVYYTYNGGAHGNTVLLSWNFDLETGTFFDPALLDGDSGFRETVARELKRQARERAAENSLAPSDFYWEDYEDTLDNWSSYAVSFAETGMSVGFSPYELAAYAAGPQVFEISYETLAPHLGGHARELLGLAPS